MHARLTMRPHGNYNKAIMEIIRINDPALLKEVALLAKEIWRECYAGIITDKQIDYMVSNFQSEKAMLELYDGGAEFYALTENGVMRGYIELEKEADALFLSKLYLHSSLRGKGNGSKALSFVKARAKELSCSSVYLHVNKYNKRAIKAYLANGFINERSLDTEIGDGFVMEDYIMRAKTE